MASNLARAGWRVEEAQAAIDADLAAATGTPDIVLLNFGANDCKYELVEATWKANYQYIIEAIHAKYPGALIYIAKAWRSATGITVVTSFDTMAGWIDDIVALYDYVHDGYDERGWLENGDDGTTYTSDGAHYNTIGIDEASRQWLTALGY